MAKLLQWGAEFLGNTTTAGNQSQAWVTGLSNGRFVMAWKDESGTGADTSGHAVRAQIFNADGSFSGGEFVVNTTTTFQQFAPVIAALSDGGFTIGFDDFSQTGGDTSSAAVRMQQYGADGSVVGGEVLVNTATLGAQSEPAITEMANGRYLVVWSNGVVFGGGGKVSPAAVGTQNGIEGQVFNADGTRFGGEFLVVAEPGAIGAGEPVVTTLADGRMVVAYSVVDTAAVSGLRFTIHAQVLGANGHPQGADFLVAGGALNHEYFAPNITALAGGGFVVTYNDRDSLFGNPNQHDAMLRVYDAAGVAQGAAFSAQVSRLDEQFVPVVQALADGRFIAVWTDVPAAADDPTYAIRAQVFNANGARSGAAILVNTTVAGIQYDPTVTELADGRIVVGWTDYSATGGDTSGWAVRGQILDPRLVAVDLAGSRVADDLVGTRFGDTMAGGTGNDSLAGAAGDDVLYGGIGGDRLAGEAGNDTLTGGAGLDRLKGGAGLDVFVFASGSARDVVTDFADGSDRIDLSAYGFANLAAATAHFANVGADCAFTFGVDVLLVRGWSVAQIGAGDLIL